MLISACVESGFNKPCVTQFIQIRQNYFTPVHEEVSVLLLVETDSLIGRWGEEGSYLWCGRNIYILEFNRILFCLTCSQEFRRCGPRKQNDEE